MLIVRFGVKCFLPELSSQCPSFLSHTASPGCLGTHCVVHRGLKLKSILLPQTPKHLKA